MNLQKPAPTAARAGRLDRGGKAMSRLHLVFVAERHVLDSELLTTHLAVDGLVESVRPEHLCAMALDRVSLVLADAACPERVFRAACTARGVGLLYDTSAVEVCSRAQHPSVRLVLPRSVSVAVLQDRVCQVLDGMSVLELPRPRVEPDTPSLSPREAQVLDLMARGLGNREIATELDISPHTVRTHVAAVLAKLNKGDRVSAVGAARTAGLLTQ